MHGGHLTFAARSKAPHGSGYYTAKQVWWFRGEISEKQGQNSWSSRGPGLLHILCFSTAQTSIWFERCAAAGQEAAITSPGARAGAPSLWPTSTHTRTVWAFCTSLVINNRSRWTEWLSQFFQTTLQTTHFLKACTFEYLSIFKSNYSSTLTQLKFWLSSFYL